MGKLKIEERDLLDLIHWARRYCDGRATYAPSGFNELYEKIVRLNPDIKEKDQHDPTCILVGNIGHMRKMGCMIRKMGYLMPGQESPKH